MPVTEFLRAIQFDTLFQNRSYAFAHTNAYVGLFTADPGDAGDQSNEVSAGEYNRMQPTWDTVNADTETIASEVNFPIATSTWGTITHVGLLDASSGGNMMAYEILSSSIDIESGDEVSLQPNVLTTTVTYDTGLDFGEDAPYAEYRQKILLESVLHGGTLGPHQSFAGLNGTIGGSGEPGSFSQEPDPQVANGYLRIPVQWTVVGDNPLTIANVNDLQWVVGSASSAEDSWRLANRAVMLVNDVVPNKSNDGAPGTRGWLRMNGSTNDDVLGGETLKVVAGSMIVTL